MEIFLIIIVGVLIFLGGSFLGWVFKAIGVVFDFLLSGFGSFVDTILTIIVILIVILVLGSMA